MTKGQEPSTKLVQLNELVDDLLEGIFEASSRATQDGISDLKDLYTKYVGKSYVAQTDTLSKDIQKRLRDSSDKDSDEFNEVFTEHVAIPILERTLEQARQKCEIGSILLEFDKGDVEKIFTDPTIKQDMSKTFADATDQDVYFDIFNTDIIPTNKDEILPCIRSRSGNPINASQKKTSKQIPDLSGFVVFSDIDCSGYKMPKSDDEIQDIFKILPLGVVGTLNCSGWDKELFSKIKKFPYAEALNCSFSINDLNELTGRLPVGLKTLIVQDTLIKANSLRDENKLESAKKFRKQYPDLVITDSKGKHTLPLDFDAPKVIEEPKPSAPKKIQQPVAPKTEPNLDGLLSITQAYEQFMQNPGMSKKTFTRKDFSNFIKLTFRAKIVPVIVNGQTQNYIEGVDYNDIEHATLEYIKQKEEAPEPQPDAPVVEKQVEPEKQEVADTTNTDNFASKTNCQIRKYISKKDLDVFSNSVDEQNNLLHCLELFNMWDQRNNINNGTCTYIENGNEKPLSGMICRHINTFSYRSDAGGVVDFKSTTLKDSNGNTVKDANGNEIYILVSIGAVPSHEKGSKNRFTHNKTIRTNDVYVTKNKLTSQQKDRITHNKQGKNITFLSLPELDLAQKYTSFVYDPMAESEHHENSIAYQEKPKETVKSVKLDEIIIKELPPEDTFQQPKEFTTQQQQPVDIPKPVVEQAPEEETWTIAELAKFLGVSDEDVREANKNLPEKNKEWFIGHTRGRRFLAKYRDAYKIWFNTSRTKPEPVIEKPVAAQAETPTKRKGLVDFKGITVFADNLVEILKKYEKELNEYNARVTDAENEVHKINERVKSVEQKATLARIKITQISEQISKRLATGSFDFEDLRIQGNTEKQKKEAAEHELAETKQHAAVAKQKLEQAKQEYQTKKDTFDKGQTLVQQYKQALAERAAADKRAADAADALAKLFGDIDPHD